MPLQDLIGLSESNAAAIFLGGEIEFKNLVMQVMGVVCSGEVERICVEVGDGVDLLRGDLPAFVAERLVWWMKRDILQTVQSSPFSLAVLNYPNELRKRNAQTARNAEP